MTFFIAALTAMLATAADTSTEPVAVDVTRSAPEPSRRAPSFTPSLDVIGGYRQVRPEDARWGHELTLERLHLGFTAEQGSVSARAVLEAVSSVEGGALVGVGGASVVTRLREAYAAVAPHESVTLRAGIVPSLMAQGFESGSPLRTLGAPLSERLALTSPADAGVTAQYTLPLALGTLGATATNGDGYTRTEQNRGKNVELAADLAPLAALELPELRLLLAYVNGSATAASVRADRLAIALGWVSPWLGARLTVVQANGANGDGDRRALTVELGLWSQPWANLLLWSRAELAQLDLDVDDSRTRSLTFAAGWRFDEALDAVVAASGFTADTAAAASTPLADGRRVELWLRTRL